MSQTNTDSSPLPSVPETRSEPVTPPTSSPDQHLPEDISRAGTPTPDLEGLIAASLSPTTSGPAMPPQSPDRIHHDMAKKSMPAPPSPSKLKRVLEDDDEEHSPPPKKAATSKAKPAPKKAVAKPAPKKAAAKKAAPPPRQPSTRPSRNRKAPERFEDLQETAKPLRELSMKKATSKVFDPVYITTNANSRLGKADIYHMLLESAAWSRLSSEQQSTLISMLPPTSANNNLLAAIKNGDTDTPRPQAFSISNDCFRTDVARLQEDLKNGHLGKTWQAAAEQAVIERAAGKYDAWKVEEAESWWGQKSKTA